MVQLVLIGVKCTTITDDSTTAYPIPSWAPDIEDIPTTATPQYSMRASTSNRMSMDTAVAERFKRAGARCFLHSGGKRNDKKSIRSCILRYQAVGEMVRT